MASDDRQKHKPEIAEIRQVTNTVGALKSPVPMLAMAALGNTSLGAKTRRGDMGVLLEIDPNLVNNPLDRMRGESVRSYSVFLDYVDLGVDGTLRQLVEVYRAKHEAGEKVKPRSYPSLVRLSSRWHWTLRVARYYEIQAGKRREMWANRVEEVRDSEWLAAKALKTLAERIAELPLARKVVRDTVEITPEMVGQVLELVVVHEPIRVSARDTALLHESASKLARRATGSDIDSGGMIFNNLNVQISDLSDGQLQRIASGEDPMTVVVGDYAAAALAIDGEVLGK